MAVLVIGGVEVQNGDAKAAARSRRAMERCTRGAEVVEKVPPAPPSPQCWKVVLATGRKALSAGHAYSFSHYSGVREAGETHGLGPGPPEAVLVVRSSTL